MDLNPAQSLILDAIFYSVPELAILQGIYVRVNAGSICGLIGRNGCGKSTLLKVGAGQIPADSGITIVNEHRISGLSRRQRFNHIAYLQQDSMLPTDIRVHRLLNGCDMVGLKQHVFFARLLDRKVWELSGGERRYLEVMLILGLKRPYILLDEPFTGVEPKIIDMITSELKLAAATGTGVLISDHYTHYLLPLIDDAYLIKSNQCVHLEGDFRKELERLNYIRN